MLLKKRQYYSRHYHSGKSIMDISFSRMMDKLKIKRKKCAYEGCNNLLPYGKRGKYCCLRCRGMAYRRRRAKREGRELAWRGERRAGL
jgi:hypothetical protein